MEKNSLNYNVDNYRISIKKVLPPSEETLEDAYFKLEGDDNQYSCKINSDKGIISFPSQLDKAKEFVIHLVKTGNVNEILDDNIVSKKLLEAYIEKSKSYSSIEQRGKINIEGTIYDYELGYGAIRIYIKENNENYDKLVNYLPIDSEVIVPWDINPYGTITPETVNQILNKINFFTRQGIKVRIVPIREETTILTGKENPIEYSTELTFTPYEYLIPYLDKIENKELTNIAMLSTTIPYHDDIITFALPVEKVLAGEQKYKEMSSISKDKSPFEQFLFAFDIAKNYKKQKDVPPSGVYTGRFKYYEDAIADLSLARNPYLILENEYIVCVGYASLMVKLLKKQGIEASTLVYELYDPNDKEQRSKEGHCIAVANIKDPKYNIDGYIFVDPTGVDTPYSYVSSVYSAKDIRSLIFKMEYPNEELEGIKKNGIKYIRHHDIKVPNPFDLMIYLITSQNKEEFYKVINDMLISEKANILTKDPEDKDELASLMINSFLHFFKSFDKELYEMILNYEGETSILLEQIRLHIQSRNNKLIPTDAIAKSLLEEYKTTSSKKDLESLKEEVARIIEVNKKYQQRVYRDGYESQEKFDLPKLK